MNELDEEFNREFPKLPPELQRFLLDLIHRVNTGEITGEEMDAELQRRMQQ